MFFETFSCKKYEPDPANTGIAQFEAAQFRPNAISHFLFHSGKFLFITFPYYDYLRIAL
jgi:hypothetical protein